MSKIDSWVTKIPRLKNSKVARFSYRAEAYANDEIEGVSSYDYEQDMNVPLATHTDFDASMLSIGARTNFSSIPKNGLNHFFGRVSYNLNKVIDFLSDFLDDFISFTEIIEFTTSTTLVTYADGSTKRLLSTAASNITITLPAGETYLGSNTIPLAPSVMLTITKRGTVWINSSNAIDDTQITNANTFSAKYINNKTQTLRYNANFTLPTFLDGTRVRLANTHTTNTITCTLPTGQTMNGQSSFTIAPDTLLEFELIGSAWKCVSKEWELIGFYSSISSNISMNQYKEVKIEVTRENLSVMATSTSRIDSIMAQDERRLYAMLTLGDNINRLGVYVRFDENKNVTLIADLSYNFVFSGLYLYGKK